MSVAFRRESDEEHLEPRPDLPIPPGPNLVTARGLALIAQQASDWEARLDAALAAVPDEAAIKEVRRNLRYWHARRATAQVAPIPDGTTVAFGTRVTYARDEDDTQTVDLVGEDEATPAEGRIAFTSPLARALMGLVPGDIAAFRAGGRTTDLDVVAVAPIPVD
ncbi:GreA/GreB family elongation factor [Sphingomonas montana]|uniref:GreA/GreB family elongation factor n=1 Tax=Sphingomonas montana TaxID=1843236 RepID=UPI00096E6204|nr:GreA/GreB family elongation factor [Sphingomonas montana]